MVASWALVLLFPVMFLFCYDTTTKYKRNTPSRRRLHLVNPPILSVENELDVNYREIRNTAILTLFAVVVLEMINAIVDKSTRASRPPRARLDNAPDWSRDSCGSKPINW
jgi:hypothetical protein